MMERKDIYWLKDVLETVRDSKDLSYMAFALSMTVFLISGMSAFYYQENIKRLEREDQND